VRFLIAIVCTVLVIGCESPQSSRDDNASIASSLEKPITNEEARHILFDDIDRSIRVAQTQASDQAELEILVKHRQKLSSSLESFLSRVRAGDQLWLYRIYATSDRRGGESGFALLRDGAVVGHMGVMIHD